MTVTEPFQFPIPAPIAVDLYRDIHKAIRKNLFDLVIAAGSIDPSDRFAREVLAADVRTAVDLLDLHAHHEDEAIGETLQVHLPALHERIERDHHVFEGRTAYLADFAAHLVDDASGHERLLVHHFYLDLAGFTSAYLAHQDVEEREVMPSLQQVLGPEQCGAIHGQIIASIPPDEMARSLALMLPVLNVDDRTEMLGGMQANAPAEVFQGVWGLAGSVLAPADVTALGRRLGIA